MIKFDGLAKGQKKAGLMPGLIRLIVFLDISGFRLPVFTGTGFAGGSFLFEILVKYWNKDNSMLNWNSALFLGAPKRICCLYWA